MIVKESFLNGGKSNSSKNAVSDLNQRWPGGVIPYEIDHSLGIPLKTFVNFLSRYLGTIFKISASFTPTLYQAFEDYHRRTCVRFVPRTNQPNYVKIFSGSGCATVVGYHNIGQQQVSLGDGCKFLGTAIHELGHALGFFHEMSRSDRDSYVEILWQNMIPGVENNYIKLAPNQNLLFTPFDSQSIMIYGNYGFSKDGRSPTMLARSGERLYEPYQKYAMTPADAYSVNRLYGC